MTPVKYQGGCSSCWAFAGVGTIEAKIKMYGGNPDINPDLSEQELVSCSDAGNCGGGLGWSVLCYAWDHGIVDEACFPYVAREDPCVRCNDYEDRLSFIKFFDAQDEPSWLGKNHTEQEHIAKETIVNHGPSLQDMFISGGYFDENNIYRCEEYSGLHFVIIAGYYDTGDISTSYWIVKNSWGTSWNGDGYFKVGWDAIYRDDVISQCGILFHPPSIIRMRDRPSLADVIKILRTLTGSTDAATIPELDFNINRQIDLGDLIFSLQVISGNSMSYLQGNCGH